MNKLSLFFIILVLFFVSNNFPVDAVQDLQKGVISVNTTAETGIEPDVAEISFTVKTSDFNSMQKATILNKEVSENVLQVLKKLIKVDLGDYIKTSDYSATPVYSYVNSKMVFDKYEVSNRIIVHTKAISNIGKMIDKSIDAGATNVDNLSFSVSNYEVECNELIKSATKKARTRANVIAEALSTNIIGIDNITTSCALNNYNPQRFYMAKNMISDTAGSIEHSDSTVISKGIVKINANISASFIVK